jgi:hypothetical protein
MLSDKEFSLSGFFPVKALSLNHEGHQGTRRTTSQASYSERCP